MKGNGASGEASSMKRVLGYVLGSAVGASASLKDGFESALSSSDDIEEIRMHER